MLKLTDRQNIFQTIQFKFYLQNFLHSQKNISNDTTDKKRFLPQIHKLISPTHVNYIGEILICSFWKSITKAFMNHSMKYNPIHNKENTMIVLKCMFCLEMPVLHISNQADIGIQIKNCWLWVPQSLFTDTISLVLTNTGFSNMSKTAGCHVVIRDH